MVTMADWVEKVDNAIADRHGWTRLTVKETAELAAEIARDHVKAAQPNQGGE